LAAYHTSSLFLGNVFKYTTDWGKMYRYQPGLQKNHIALFGHSRGGGAALNYVYTHPHKVQALILNSTGYPTEVIEKAPEITLPVLIIHGTALTNIELAKQFAAALKAAKKNVETKYYETSGHNGLFSDATQQNDTIYLISTFLTTHFVE
jgi:pimeloyl-ACP methyl ester carboxylesterase